MAAARVTPAPVAWDYGPLARHYESRAPYHPDTVRSVLALSRLGTGGRAADVGAGTGRFSRALAEAGFTVDAIEPAPPMRAIGEERCRHLPVRWIDARGEATGLPDGVHRIVAFASSFNVVEPAAALAEAARLLAPEGLLVCLWNHRDLDDPVQRAIERRVRARVPGFAYGSRREDPTPRITASGFFGDVRALSLPHVHRAPVDAFLDGFRAHATLVRQAGRELEPLLADLRTLLSGADAVTVPFATRVWLARRGRSA